MLIPQAIVQQGGAGALTQLSSTTLGSAQASIDITSISGAYNHLRLECILRSSRAGQTFDYVIMTVNNDSGSNYDLAMFQGTGVSTSTSEQIGATQWGNGTSNPTLAHTPGATSNAGAAAELTIEFPFYANTTWHKDMKTTSFAPLEEVSGNQRQIWSFGKWRSTSAINRVTLTLGSGANYVTGSQVIVYGIL